MNDPIDRAHFVDAPGGPLFAVETSVPGAADRGIVVLCSGAWIGGSSLKNRLLCDLARELATAGFTAVRFDWQGSGESAGHVDQYDLGAPLVTDVEAIIEDAQRGDPKPLYLIGICYGALALLPPAVAQPAVGGVGLVSLPILAQAGTKMKQRRSKRIGLVHAVRTATRPTMIRGWFDSSTRAFYLRWLRVRLGRKQQRTRLRVPDALRDVDQLLERGVPTLFLYGEEDWQAATAGSTGLDPITTIVDRFEGLVDLETIPGDLKGFPELEVQQQTNRAIVGWLRRVAAEATERGGQPAPTGRATTRAEVH